METSERIKICSSCNNREFNPQTGIVCSLTKEKPNFEESCSNYSANISQETRSIAEKFEPDEEDKRISGWLAFFLWGGVGAGAVISTATNLMEFLSQGYNATITTLGLLYTFILLATAVYTIVAFLRRDSNAVALAKTYIAMIFLDGVTLLAFSIISDDKSLIYDAIRQFLWAAGWFLFLITSNKVKVIIPKEIRTYRAVEKILLIAYAAVAITFTSLLAYAVKSGDFKTIVDEETYISSVVEEEKKKTPKDLGDDTIMQNVFLKEKNVVFVYRLTYIYEADAPLDEWNQVIEDEKRSILENLTSEYDTFVDTCFKQGYNLVYRFTNATGQTLFSITITPEEYFKLK